MARPIWKGTLSFGLVTIPVTLHSAESNFDLHFRLIDSRNKAAIRYERVNEITGEEVPWNSVVKGYEYEKGNYVLLTEEDFKHADVRAFETIEIEDFVDRDDIAPIYFQKPYYTVPQKKAEKGYVLLREILKETKKVGIARIVVRTRQHIAAVFPCCDALIVNILRYQQEIRNADSFDLPGKSLRDYRVSPREMEMAKQLVESFSSSWKPEKYHDDYHDNLLKWIQRKAKAHGGPIKEEEEPEKEPVTTNKVDILELLKKSIRPTHNGHVSHNGHAKAHSK